MPIEITATGSDDNVLAQVAADGGFPVSVRGSVRNCIEQVAADAAVGSVPAFSDANAIEWLAGLMAGRYVLALAAPGAAAAFGAQALAVDGLVASIVLPAGPAAQYAATATESVAVDWVGRRALEFVCAAAGSWTWVARGLINDPPTIDAVWRWNPGAGNWSVVVSGVVQNTYAGAANDVVAVVVNGATGDVEFWKGGALQETAAALMAGQSVFPMTLTQDGVEGASMSSQFVVTGHAHDYGGAGDW